MDKKIQIKVDSQHAETPKAVYVKPLIKQVKLVPGETVLGVCKTAPFAYDSCQPAPDCAGYTPAS